MRIHENSLEDLLKQVVLSNIQKSEIFFMNYLEEHKEEIGKQLLETGKYDIVSPYGLTAHITAERKENENGISRV